MKRHRLGVTIAAGAATACFALALGLAPAGADPINGTVTGNANGSANNPTQPSARGSGNLCLGIFLPAPCSSASSGSPSPLSVAGVNSASPVNGSATANGAGASTPGAASNGETPTDANANGSAQLGSSGAATPAEANSGQTAANADTSPNADSSPNAKANSNAKASRRNSGANAGNSSSPDPCNLAATNAASNSPFSGAQSAFVGGVIGGALVAIATAIKRRRVLNA